jgi:hypothetical protein
VTNVTTDPSRTTLDPREIARRIEYRLRPWWTVWYGRHTRHYWALAAWVPGLRGMLSAPNPDALDAAITTFEMLHPKPMERHTDALVN